MAQIICDLKNIYFSQRSPIIKVVTVKISRSQISKVTDYYDHELFGAYLDRGRVETCTRRA